MSIRLPVPGSDDGQWGGILNDFLEVEHNDDGTLKIRTDGTVATLTAGKISPTQLGGGTASSSNFLRGDGIWAVPSGGGSSASNATDTTPGLIQLSGDLGGSATSPTVPGLAGKEPTITSGSANQYWRGDKSWQILDKTAVGLDSVDNTADTAKPISSATQTALDLKATDTAVVHLAGTETVTGDKDFTGGITINGTNIVVTNDSRLTDERTPLDGSVTNAKLDSATQTAIGAISGKYTKPGSGIPASDLDSATQTAITSISSKASTTSVTTETSRAEAAEALLAPLASPTFTGTVTVPAPSNNTDAATKHYVDTAVINSRATATATTTSLAPTASDSSTTMPLSKGFRLYSLQTSAPARIRLYETAAQQTADASRGVGTDPASTAGVILDYVTTNTTTNTLSPLVDGVSLESSPSANISMTVTNNDSSTETITVTFVWIRTE